MKRPLLPASLFILLLLSACRPETAAPVSVTAVVTAPASPTAQPIPAVEEATEPAATEPAGSPATPTASPESVASLFDVAPDDRSVYAAGLTSAEQRALSELPGAPVYHMALTLSESMSVVSGRQTVTYTNLEDVALEEVYFHLHANTLDGSTEVTDVTVAGAPVEPVVTDANMLRVPLPSPLAPGETTSIDMQFVTKVPTDIGRNYGVLAYYEGILALAHFYPMLSVYDEEGWNVIEPVVQGDLTYSDAAFYLVEVTAPADTILVGAGTIVEQSESEGAQTVTYALGPARDFYLAAGDFVAVSETVGETTINSYAPAALGEGAAVALEVAAAALAEHSQRLAPFPYTELDIVTTPTSALGIEYPGLIVGTLRMYDMEGITQSGLAYKVFLESTTAHEVAHQWFYNFVGNDQLDEPWLDEAVTSYSTYRYYVDQHGQRLADAFFSNFIDRWNRVEREEIPIGLPVAAYDETEYSAIVYGRGPVFLRELEETMGRETFDAFLRDYVAQYRWDIATTEAFRALAEQHCGCDLGPLFAEWVYK